MEKFLTLYIYANVPAQFLFDDGKGVAWDNAGKILTYEQSVAMPFPSEVDPIIINDFQFTAKRMGGAPTITASFTYHECLDKIWSYKVFTVFNGERYFIKQRPSSGIANTDGRYQHSIELVSERVMLDNVYFYDVVSSGTVEDKPVSNSSKFSFYGDIDEFVRRLNESLKYRNLDYTVVIDDGIVSGSFNVSFENKVISEALQEIYNTYNLPYYFDGKTIHVGYTNNAITETFRYGASDALLSINKENANYKVVTAVSGSGSEDNIPYYYPNEYESKAEVEANGGTWIQPSSTLQPPIYRESLGKERFYKAENDTYQIPGSTETYVFDNLYEEGRPKEHIIDFSDIKPTITGIKNALGYGIDTFLDFAYDQDDNDDVDEEGNYVHPYFFAKLRKFDGANGFNLFDHAIDEAQMTISMTSGSCGSCEWVIGVGEDTQKNLVQVDSDGNLLRDENGNVRCGREGLQNEEPQDRQNDTQNYEVWIALKKDINTFGVVMPNATNNYKPSTTDTFVILHIDLPKAYILAAEERLKDALIAYMADNNSEKFNFSISFSRIYFAENPDVLAKLNENARVQIEYNGDYIELYVSSFSYTMSESAPLPEIKVELSDTLSISQNAIQTMINDLKGSGFGGIGAGASGDILKLGLAYFLRKDTNDRTRGKLSTDVGFEVGRFVSGASGAIMYIDKQTGRTVAELDKLYVRVKAYFETLEIVHVNSVGGKQIISPAGSMKCTAVENDETKDYYRCYVLTEQDGEEIENRFHVGDQVYSQMFNAKPGVSNKVSNHYWWRLCVGVGDNYIDLSKSDCDVDSDVPAVGDIMCHRGNRDDVDRQNFLEFSSVDAFSPNITLFQGVNSYSLVGKDVISYGVDKTTNQSFMNLYGNMYVGDRDGNSYLRYTIENGLELKGRLHIGTTFGDSTLEDAIKKASTTYKEDLDAYKLAMETTVNDLQGQIDGAIESWFYDPTPTLDNLPASLWTTDEDKNAHLGDLYYSAEGRAYRFQLNSETNTYYWNEIVDTDIVKALENAKNAQDTADSKRKTFVRQPTASDSYDIGDIWLNATYSDENVTYSNDMLRATTAKAAGEAFSIEHWTLASKYTDDTVAKEALESAKKANETAGKLQTTVSSMKDFTDEAFADGIITRSERVGISQYINQVETVKAQVTQSYNEVYNNALLEGVAKTNLKSGYDAFITAATELVNQINSVIADDEATSAERAAVDAKYAVFNTKYGDYTSYLNAAIKSIEEKLNASISEYAYLKEALQQETTTVGGLILTSAVVLGYTDDNKNRITMSGINGLVTEKAKRTPAFWAGGDMVDIFDYYDSSTGKFNVPAGVRPATAMDRMDGTGYRAGGSFWWDNDGMLHADPLSFFVGEDTVGALLASFQVVLKADNKSPDYLIPKVPFQSLNIATTLDLGKYRLNPGDALELTRTDGKNADFVTTGNVVAYSTGNYDLVSPIASASALGMIKVGENLTITADGTLNAKAGGGASNWSELQGKPTTLAGYGITDAAKASDLTSHTGNSDIHVTAANKTNWNTAYNNSHTHSNKTTLDNITSTNVSNWNTAYNSAHSHSNYSTLDSITSSNVSNWNTAYNYAHSHSNKSYLDNINQNLSTSSTPTFSGGLVTGSTSGLNIQHSSGNSINGRSGTSIANLYFNYSSASKNVLVDADCNVKAYGDVIAYSTGTASAPFKYWYPSVNSSGDLSWTNSTSTSTPSTVNIKGTKGDKGDTGKSVGKVSAYSTSSASGGSSVYRVYDTSNSLLGSFTVYNGQKGEKGDKGETGATGPTGSMSASSRVNLPSGGTVFTAANATGTKLGVKFSGGNGILGWNTSSNSISNLYLNNGAPSGVAVKITNYEPISGSDIRIKNIFYDVPNVLDKIEEISAFYYTLKEDEDKILKIGVSAQAVRKVFPEAVTLIMPDGHDAYYGVNYMQLLTAVGINGLKELHALVKSQQAKIEELENRIKELESK